VRHADRASIFSAVPRRLATGRAAGAGHVRGRGRHVLAWVLVALTLASATITLRVVL
jgi:hypothetical protein